MVALEMLTGLVEPKLNAGRSVAPAGLDVTDAVSVTLPVKPPLGVILIVEVPLWPGLAMVMLPPVVFVRANVPLFAGAVTVTLTTAVAVVVPEVPVTVTT
jgi:hypothetical protein